MNEIVNELINDFSTLKKKIEDYVFSNDKWLYYFASDNNVIRLITHHPDDWHDYVEVTVEYLSSTSIYVSIEISDEENEIGTTLRRWITLSTFAWNVQSNYVKYHNNAVYRAIEDKEKELKYFEEKVRETKEEINKLKETNKK